jgi:pyruvate,orthophosphate dikinase
MILRKLLRRKLKKNFPQNVHEQLFGAISAVFLSWESNRAKIYRKLNQIPSEWGTAVNVQSMVFGNMGNDCATGVVFTRNPSDGFNDIYGEYLINAQGEDVVAGTRTPQYITKKARKEANVKDPSHGRVDAQSLQTTRENSNEIGKSLQRYAGCRVYS